MRKVEPLRVVDKGRDLGDEDIISDVQDSDGKPVGKIAIITICVTDERWDTFTLETDSKEPVDILPTFLRKVAANVERDLIARSLADGN